MIRALRLPTALVCAALIAAGCGGSDKDDDGGKTTAATPTATEATATPSAAPTVAPLNNDEAGKIKPHTPRGKVEAQLGTPVLVQRPTPDFAGGCIYYPIQKAPIASLWQYCFDKVGVNVIVTQLAHDQPEPPAEASQKRGALIGRGDTICQSEYGYLKPITAEVSKTLKALDRKGSQANREAVGKAIGKFRANLIDTHLRLEAFDPPPDGLDSLTAYLDGLEQQIGTLKEAKDALLAKEDDQYDALGKQFTTEGETAAKAARDYGFSTCAAASFA